MGQIEHAVEQNDLLPGLPRAEIQKFGTIVYERIVEGSTKAALIFKHMHGGATSENLYASNPSFIDALIEEGDSMTHSCHELIQKLDDSQLQNLRFVLDGQKGALRDWDEGIRQKMLPDVARFEREWHSTDPSLSSKRRAQIDAWLKKGGTEAHQASCYAMAVPRIAAFCLEQGRENLLQGDAPIHHPGWSNRINQEIQSLRIRAMKNVISTKELSNIIARWKAMKKHDEQVRHEYMTQLLLPDGLTVYLTGAGHFRSGNYVPDQPIALNPLEDYFDRAEASYVIIEPPGYLKLVQKPVGIRKVSVENVTIADVRSMIGKVLK